MCLPVNHKLYYKATLQTPGLRGSFEHMLVSLGIIWFLFQYFQSIRADCRANSAVVPLVIPEVVFLFPLITCPYIQYLFTDRKSVV